jgi:hypothetical protein
MLREFLVLFLLGHVLGDFYFQTDSMAAKKEKNVKWVLIHSLVYTLIMFVICLPVMNATIAIGAAMASVFHLMIDLLKYRSLSTAAKKGKKTRSLERKTFFADQLLHLFGILVIAYMMVLKGPLGLSWAPIHEFFHYIGMPEALFRSIILVLLLVHKPSNMIIQKLLMPYKPDIGEEKASNNAGRFIGTLERVIMVIFLFIGQYAAIGLVLTAKSIARYDRISKEKDFAEYYLLGTLTSTLLAIVSYFVI